MTVQATYTLDELARLWGGGGGRRVPRATLYFWLKLERKAGRGPTRDQAVVKMVNGKKALMLRADYASKIQSRYVFRALRKRKMRVETGGRKLVAIDRGA